jgi:hypothetical protein
MRNFLRLTRLTRLKSESVVICFDCLSVGYLGVIAVTVSHVHAMPIMTRPIATLGNYRFCFCIM